MAKKLLDYNLDDLYEWIETGRSLNVPEELFLYAEILDKIRAMMLRKDIYGNKEAIIKHLVNFDEHLKNNRPKANQFYAESIEYFYTQDNISKKAWRNLYAEDLDKAYDLAISLAQNTADVEKASKIKERAAKVRALDQEEPEKLPDNFFTRPNKIYTTDMDKFELGNVDRKELEIWIDENTKKLTPKAIDRIKQEALITKVKIFQNEEENPRKD